MTDARHTADTINDDALDALYAERDRLRAACLKASDQLHFLHDRLPAATAMVHVVRVRHARDLLDAALKTPTPKETR